MTSSTPKPLSKVLVIDDDPILAQTAGEVLRRQGMELQVCHDAEEGLRLALSWHPDLILLDVVLEGMDGFAMLAKLRSAPQTRDIAVVLFTGFPVAADERRAVAMGAAYVSKPIKAPDLARIVKDRLAAG